MYLTRHPVKLAALFLSLSTLCIAQNPYQPSLAVQNGDHWDKLYTATTTGAKAGGMGMAMMTGGISGVKSVLIYRDATAPVHTTSLRPVFKLVGDANTAPRDIIIVRLQQKKNHRELQIGKANAYTGFNMEYPPSETFKVDVKQDGDGMVITPAEDLKPGEYIVFTASGMPSGYGGFDFAVTPAS